VVLRLENHGATVVSVSQGFQPAGRAPAPPPLDLVQDFVNTEIPEWAQDDIATPEALAGWLGARGLLAPDEIVDPATFVAARALRTALRELALLNTLGAPAGDDRREELERAFACAHLSVAVAADGRLEVVPAGSGADAALAVIVATVLDAQTSGTWTRLKACRKETCGWLFYDGSRNRSSSWCSMSICGNRVKTAAYRRRHGARR
jgi:predicted RNA-binding Zn ribbon-like protein